MTCDSEDLDGRRGTCNIGKELKYWLKYWKRELKQAVNTEVMS